jgi:hypothetical protein
MHILRINNSGKSKILIRPPEVQLGIARPHAKVGQKT